LSVETVAHLFVAAAVGPALRGQIRPSAYTA
jgi:hypothetical protein